MRFHAAALLAAGVGAEFAFEVRSFHPAPSRTLSAIDAARADAHGACLADAELLCRPRDPFEELLRGSAVREALPPPSPGSFFESSDPFFRDDPFLRLALSPPSAFESPRVLDQVFPNVMRMVQPPEADAEQEQQEDGAEEDFTCLFQVLDSMMESAMRTALEPPPSMRHVTIVFGPENEESEAGSPADVAVSLMDSMVNGLLDHAASASASASVDEAEEEEDQEEEEEPLFVDDVYDPDEEEEEPEEDGDVDDAVAPVLDDPEVPVQTVFASQWDPNTLAEMISQHGRDVLAEEDEEDKELRRNRRRLTEEDATRAEVRRRMARRLTEVVPFGRLTVVPLTTMSMSPPPVVRLAEREDDVVVPRLGFSFRTDRCLWSRYQDSEATLSGGCTEALRAVEKSLGQLRREGTAAAPEAAPAGVRGLWYRYVEFLQMQPNSFWYLWAALLTALLGLVCMYDEDEEEGEYEDYGDASDYVLIQDTDESEDEKDDARAPEGSAAAFVGVPLPVV